MDVFWTLPPVSRTITAAALVFSALGYSGMMSLGNLVFWKQAVFTTKIIPQLWRVVTAFFITKPKFAILMDPYFLYQYGSGLERESSRFTQPGDFFMYTMFVGSLIVATAGYIIQTYTFLPALSLAYAYTYAQDNPTRQVSMFIVTFDAKFLPYAMLLMTFVIDGPDAALPQSCGLIAAHMYDFLTRIWPTFGGGTNYIKTPQAVKRWFGAAPGVAQARPYGFAQRGGGAGTATASGSSTGFTARGPGRRLGD